MDEFDFDDFSESNNNYDIKTRERLRCGSSERSFWIAGYL